MNEIKDLKRDDRIILWQYKGLMLQDGHTGRVIQLNYINQKLSALVKLDGVEEPFELTDKDYFDKLPINFKKTQHSKDCDNVNHPTHYNQSDLEVIDIMEALPSKYDHKTLISLSNVVKYIFRAPFKNGVEDLNKAKWYLERAAKNYGEETK